MPEIEMTDDVILGFIKWTQRHGVTTDNYSDEEMAKLIDDYMRSRMAGG